MDYCALTAREKAKNRCLEVLCFNLKLTLEIIENVSTSTEENEKGALQLNGDLSMHFRTFLCANLEI